jgi:hypothetical protein
MTETVAVDPARKLQTKTVYSYSPVTGEYTGTDVSRESPLEPGVFHMPANATATQPPAAPAGQIAVWANNAWSLVVDNRGQRVYNTDTATAAGIYNNLTPIPADLTLLKPATPQDKWNGSAWASPPGPYYAWNGSAWTLDTAAQAAGQLAAYKANAAQALSDSDSTMHRIAEAVALGANSWTSVDVVAWVNYRRALRVAVSATQVGTLPSRPSYPAGT